MYSPTTVSSVLNKPASSSKNQQYMEDIKKISHDYHKSVFEKGKDHPDSQNLEAELQATKANAVSQTGLTNYHVEHAATLGQQNFNDSIKPQKDAATKSLSDAAYSYYFKKETLGVEHPETKAAESALSQSKQAGKKYLDPLDMGSVEIGAENQAKNAKDLQEKLKNLGTDPVKIVASYDQQASTFKYPEEDYGLSVKFANFQSTLLEKLTPTEELHLNAHTGSAYSDFNKAVGAASLGQGTLGSDMRAKMHALDSAFAKSKLGVNVKLNREFPVKYIAQAFGGSMPSNPQELVGKIYTENAMASTTMQDSFFSYAGSGNQGEARFRIRAGADQKGIRTASISHHSSEKEVTLPRGSTYIIRSAKKLNSTHGKYGDWEFEVDLIGCFPKKI
jgi:hypothetical protein